MGAHTGLRGLQVPGAPSGPLRRARQQRPTSVVTQVSSPTAAESDVEATEAAMRAAKQSNGVHVQPLRVAIQAETDDLRSKFTKIQAEVSAYRALSVENGKLEDEVVRLRQVRDCNSHLQRFVVHHAAQNPRQSLADPHIPMSSCSYGLSRVKRVTATQRLYIRTPKLTYATRPLQYMSCTHCGGPLTSVRCTHDTNCFCGYHSNARVGSGWPTQEVESLSAQLAARQQEMKLAVEAARVEATGPLQQQLEELSMQLQNSQVCSGAGCGQSEPATGTGSQVQYTGYAVAKEMRGRSVVRLAGVWVSLAGMLSVWRARETGAFPA